MDLKGAIFDMDGTLVDSLIFWGCFWEELSKKYLNGKAFAPDTETDKTIRTTTLPMCVKILHERFGFGESYEEFLAYTEEYMARFYRERVQAKPGVKEYLEELKKKGVKMCVASASAVPMLEICLKTCGLRDYFSILLSCKDFGVGKDQPDVYLAALEQLGTPKEETFVFEDSYVALCTAHSIGMKTVGIYDPFNYDQDKMAVLADYYIAEGETMLKLLKT